MRTALYVIGLSVVLAAAEVRSAQALPEWRLTPPLSDVEKARVLALAARLNIDRPSVITREVIHHPLECEALRIESVPAVDGNRRTWKRIWASNTDGPRRCPTEKPDAPRVDNWVVADRAPDVGAWRVQDRDGFVDVETPSSIPYPDVESIVQAVKTGRLVNRLPPEYRGNVARAPKVDAKSIYLIWNYQWDPSLYKVKFRTTNVVLLVAVQGTRVELRGWMTEIA